MKSVTVKSEEQTKKRKGNETKKNETKRKPCVRQSSEQINKQTWDNAHLSNNSSIETTELKAEQVATEVIVAEEERAQRKL